MATGSSPATVGRVLQAEQRGKLGEGVVEQRDRVVQGEVQVAELVDGLGSLGATLPWMALLVAATTFVLLFLAFGSVVLPVRAIVMNVLSLTATFGAIVWIFQEGHLSGLLHFTPTGTLGPVTWWAPRPLRRFYARYGIKEDSGEVAQPPTLPATRPRWPSRGKRAAQGSRCWVVRSTARHQEFALRPGGLGRTMSG